MNAAEELAWLQERTASILAAQEAREEIRAKLDSLDPKDTVELVRQLWEEVRPTRRKKGAPAGGSAGGQAAKP